MTNSNSSFTLSRSALKKGWQVVKFGDIAREAKRSTKTAIEDGLEFYVGLEHLDPKSLRIQRKGVIAEDKPSFTRRFKAGQILFGKRRCYQKKAAVADFEGICSGDIIVMEAFSGKIIPELLPFIVQSDMFFDWAERTSSGSLSPRTKWKALAEFEFPLPPLERQKEILEVLEKVKRCKYLYEDSLNSAQFNQNNYLTVWLLDNYKRSDWVKLSSVLLRTPEYGAPETAISYSEDTYRYIRVTDINSRGELYGDAKMGAPKSGNDKYLLSDDDFLIARSGNTVGKTFLYKSELAPSAIFAGYLIRLQLDLRQILPEFFKFYCRTPLFWRWLESNARGGAQPNINAKQIANMDIPLPTIYDQKKCIVALKGFEQLSVNLSEQNRKSYHLNQRLLKSMLWGCVK